MCYFKDQIKRLNAEIEILKSFLRKQVFVVKKSVGSSVSWNYNHVQSLKNKFNYHRTKKDCHSQNYARKREIIRLMLAFNCSSNSWIFKWKSERMLPSKSDCCKFLSNVVQITIENSCGENNVVTNYQRPIPKLTDRENSRILL